MKIKIFPIGALAAILLGAHAHAAPITMNLTDQDQQAVGQLPLQLTDCLASIASNDGDRASCRIARNVVAAIANTMAQTQRMSAEAAAAKAKSEAEKAKPEHP